MMSLIILTGQHLMVSLNVYFSLQHDCAYLLGTVVYLWFTKWFN